MADRELAALRAEARRKRKNVTDKISRLRRNNGVELTGTTHDPRVDVTKLKRYNKRQLQAHIQTMTEFTSRSTSYVAGARGQVLPRAKWREYKRLEERYNAIGAGHMDKIGNYRIPNTGLTVRERVATFTPDSKRAQGDVVQRPYSPTTRKSIEIADSKALDKLIKSFRSKVGPGYLKKTIRKSREVARTMLERSGDARYTEALDKLTDSQFDILWNYTPFANDLSEDYEIRKLQAANIKETFHDSVLERGQDDIRAVLEWAASLPDNAGQTSRGTRQTRSSKKTPNRK